VHLAGRSKPMEVLAFLIASPAGKLRRLWKSNQAWLPLLQDVTNAIFASQVHALLASLVLTRRVARVHLAGQSKPMEVLVFLIANPAGKLRRLWKSNQAGLPLFQDVNSAIFASQVHALLASLVLTRRVARVHLAGRSKPMEVLAFLIASPAGKLRRLWKTNQARHQHLCLFEWLSSQKMIVV
jgi:uncharacterized protein (UPF0276 family)